LRETLEFILYDLRESSMIITQNGAGCRIYNNSASQYELLASLINSAWVKRE